MDPVYLTVFVPGTGPLRLEMPTDGACAVKLRILAQTGSQELDGQGGASVGQGPGPQTPNDPWAALGIQPRD
jgi:hypothetical protein